MRNQSSDVMNSHKHSSRGRLEGSNVEMRIVYIGDMRPGVDIGSSGQFAHYGHELEIDSDIARSLLKDSASWARGNSAAAKQAKQQADRVEPEPPAMRPGQIFAQQLRAVRERRRWNQQQLADRLAQLGEPMDRSTIAKIENGSRQVSLDEALRLAAALEVSPVHLFTDPPHEGPASRKYGPTPARPRVRLAAKLAVSPREARMWIRGQQPLRGADRKIFYTEVSDEEWVAMQQHGIRFLLDRVNALMDAVVAEDHTQIDEAIDAINGELERHRRAAEQFKQKE
jgi:transcriptional regulator with XRE-family HTH domain